MYLPLVREAISKSPLKDQIESFQKFEKEVYDHNNGLFLFFDLHVNQSSNFSEDWGEEKLQSNFFVKYEAPNVFHEDVATAIKYIILPNSKMLIAKINAFFGKEIIKNEKQNEEQVQKRDISGKMEMN